jgi:hypothetical protein
MVRLRFANFPVFWVLALLFAAAPAWAAEYRGQVFFGAVPVPGATVTMTQDGTRVSTVTDQQGLYEFRDLPDGAWKIEIAMRGFSTLKGAVTVAPNAPQGRWELKMLGLRQMLAVSQEVKPLETRPASEAEPQAKEQGGEGGVAATPEEEQNAEKAENGLLINGTESNANTSPYSLAPAFGNHRPGTRGQYNGGLGAVVDNSVLDARPYSLNGAQTQKPAYNSVTGMFTVGGPIMIPHLFYHGPNFYVAYQWTRNTDATIADGLVPTSAERNGDLSGLLNAQGQPVTIYNPVTGMPFTGNLPVSTQAAALLNLYPLPNVSGTGNARYNYQADVLSNTHTDSLESHMERAAGHKDYFYGGFGFRSVRAGSVNLFDFLDTTNTLGIDTNVNWSHRYRRQAFVVLGYHFTRLRTDVRPEFERRTDISGEAGIAGNDPDPADWGPPSLTFASGIAGLSDGESAFDRNRTDELSVKVSTAHRKHYLAFGGDFRRQEYNQYQQENPRGAFAFTGAATRAGGSTSTDAASGSDLADFLLGIPDTSAIAFGNPDKYFRQSVYDLFFTDDWRLMPELTIDAGIRWDFGAPMTELFGRLVNLDIAPGFTAVAPVVGSSPKGPATGTTYPHSLVRPDMRGFEPRVGISWRPLPASTLVIRAGYGIYEDTSVYLSAAEMMAQQAPLSTSLNVANSNTCALTLADGFRDCGGTTADNFAIDPNLHVGYAQIWQVSAQQDLPWALVMTATYEGAKGTHGMQEFLPNTYPIGAANPCPSCPSGFVYRTSGGNSTRQAATIQLRRRLRSGFTATVDYTYSKSIDDDAQVGGQGHVEATSAVSSGTGPPSIAQNWRDLRAERGLSSFDQRHLVSAQVQYTTGMGLGGGTLLSGWRGTVVKEWTALSRISAGTGLPETPIYLATTPGTGMTGTIRPDLTGAPIYQAQPGYHLNGAAFAAPAAGQWGTAGRDSITGPYQFSMDAAMQRTFRLREPFNLDVRIDATNLLNHASFTAWNAIANSTTFGLPAGTHSMRSLQVTARLRF